MGNQHQLPTVCQPPVTPSRGVMIASYLLMACTLLLVMWQRLLPGLLCACLGFLLTRALSSLLARIDQLLRDVDKLPVANAVGPGRAAAPPDETPPERPSWWRRWLGAVAVS